MRQLLFESSSIKNMNLHVMPTDKFKTTTISVLMEQDLKEETVTPTALIPFVLKRGSAKFPTTKELRQYLEHLFGAVFQADVFKKGEKQIIQFQLEVANEKFLSDPSPLLEKAIEFLGEVITKPLLEGAGFSKSYVKSEADLLKSKIASLVDDKIRYANQRVTEEMCKDEPYRFLAYGKTEDLNDIDPSSLYTYYQRLLSQSPIDIYVVGDVQIEEITAGINKYFSIQRTEIKNLPFAPVQKEVKEVNLVVDRMNVGQGKLNIGCRTGITLKDENYEALLVYNGILGGFPHSKLFINVREKASLAYYAVSRLESHKGILMLMSGIEVDKYDQAVEIMKEQLQMLKDGEISEKELAQTKAGLINQLLETNDNARTIIDFFFSSKLSGKDRALEQMMQRINQVSKEDVVQIASGIQMDTIYFLRDEEGK